MSFSASGQILPNPQGEYVLCRIDIGMVQMTATHASEFRLCRAILPVGSPTAIESLTGVIRYDSANRCFASQHPFQFVPAGFQNWSIQSSFRPDISAGLLNCALALLYHCTAEIT